MKQAVIYVAGLGDHRARSQQIAVSWWRLYGMRPEVVLMNWLVDEPFEAKLSRLLEQIDTRVSEGYRVSLVGVSAGASAVVNAYANRQNEVHRVVCICGKLRHPETISATTYRRNPAFRESLALLPASLDALPTGKRRRILSIRPLADESVAPKDTMVSGFSDQIIPSAGHVLSIGLAITVFSPLIFGFIRRD